MAGGSPESDLYARFYAFWKTPPGWRAASAVNHTAVGRRYIVTSLAFFLIGGLLAMAIRSQLAWFGNTDLGHEAYNQFVTMHGTTMMFLFAVPAMEGFAIYLIPKMIGARDLPFPRLSALGYWSLLFGGTFLFSSFLFGAAPDGGWFMYVPLNDKIYSPGLNADFWLLGITFVEISAVSAAIELIVSILKTRAPGMTLARMPLFAWYILVVAFMIVFGFPPLILASVLLELERSFGFVFFDAGRGGDPLLWQHLFWLFGHPEVYIIFLPAAGVVTMVVEAFARRPLAGYSWVVAAVVGTGVISFGLWVHHMYSTGIPRLALGFFAAASMAVAIPSGIQVFAWIATLWNGTPRVTVPLLYVLGFLFVFVLGGLTGVMVALVPFDQQVHDTHFVVAHLHYVLFGGMVFPLIAGLYYWLPLVSGRVASDRLGRIGFWAVFAGFNITFLIMHLTGMQGMPRRVYTYSEGLGWEWFNLVSTIGSFILAAGIAVIAADILLHFRHGEKRGANPWRAGTLEWAMQAPVPPFNFVSIPPIDTRLPLWHQEGLAAAAERGEYFLADPASGRRETLGTSVTAAQPEQVIRLPHPSWHPLWVAAAGIVSLTGVLLQAWWLSLPGLAAVLVVLLLWAWDAPSRGAPSRIDAGHGHVLPNQTNSGRGPGRTGAALALLASAVVFASLVFAWFFLRTLSPAWPPSGFTTAAIGPVVLAVAILLAGSAAMAWAMAANRRGDYGRFRLALGGVWLSGLVFLGIVWDWIGSAELAGRGAQAYPSLVRAIWGYQGLHLLVGLTAAGFAFARSRRGHIDRERSLEADVTAMLWHYGVAVAVAALVVVPLSSLVT